MIALGIFFYVIVYTIWLKRSNASNIVIGGFAGSAASMAGWSTTTGSIDALGFMIGWLVFMWTPPHFWCLAIKTREEYASVNGTNVTGINWESKDGYLYSCKHSYFITVFIKLILYGPGLGLCCDCCDFWLAHAYLPL